MLKEEKHASSQFQLQFSILATRPHRAEHATALNIVVNYYATRM